MPKKVIVIASGDTERRSLPHLISYLKSEGIIVNDVRIPARNKCLNVEMVEKLVKSAWFENVASPPDKFVVLIDADGKPPDEVLKPFRENLPARLSPQIPLPQIAFAQWHLEAWFFADITNLREYLGRDPGHVDPSKPDEIQNPKQHLRNLLNDRVYTAVVSEEIATTLKGETIAGRSPSFKGFVDAVRNGGRT